MQEKAWCAKRWSNSTFYLLTKKKNLSSSHSDKKSLITKSLTIMVKKNLTKCLQFTLTKNIIRERSITAIYTSHLPGNRNKIFESQENL